MDRDLKSRQEDESIKEDNSKMADGFDPTSSAYMPGKKNETYHSRAHSRNSAQPPSRYLNKVSS